MGRPCPLHAPLCWKCHPLPQALERPIGKFHSCLEIKDTRGKSLPSACTLLPRACPSTHQSMKLTNRKGLQGSKAAGNNPAGLKWILECREHTWQDLCTYKSGHWWGLCAQCQAACTILLDHSVPTTASYAFSQVHGTVGPDPCSYLTGRRCIDSQNMSTRLFNLRGSIWSPVCLGISTPSAPAVPTCRSAHLDRMARDADPRLLWLGVARVQSLPQSWSHHLLGPECDFY